MSVEIMFITNPYNNYCHVRTVSLERLTRKTGPRNKKDDSFVYRVIGRGTGDHWDVRGNS